MKNIYLAHLENTKELDNDKDRLDYHSAILRSLTQLVTVTTLEWVKRFAINDVQALDNDIERFRKPADGMPITLLDNLVPIVHSNGEKQYLKGWFEKSAEYPEPLCQELQKWVQFRNKRQAHGVVDQKQAEDWATKTFNLIEQCLSVFEKGIPSINADKLLTIDLANKKHIVETPLLIDEQAIVISEVKQKKTGWKLMVQLLNNDESKEVTKDLPDSNVFVTNDAPYESYKIIEVFTGSEEAHILQHNSPVRQTDTFQGRTDELEALIDWLNDSDSRRCLVHGDGGYGKTTLVLEFINQLLGSELDLECSPPQVICYYSAKMTRWTASGITYFTGIKPVLDDSVRELMLCMYDVLTKDWYTSSGRALIDKAAAALRANKFSRNDILIILDNTETLASTPQDTKELAKLIDLLGRLVGRVIVTSRRQEAIEAKQLLVEGLTVQDSVNLLKSLAEQHNAKPILQAGEATLRRVSEKLTYKPILLEALVVYISRASVGIEQALDSLYRKSNDELLEFLYEDAWERIGELHKDAFFVLASLKCPLDQYSISRVCQLVEIQHSEFQTSLAETHFAHVTDYGSHYTLELIELAERFFVKKLKEKISQDQERIESLAAEVEGYVIKRNEIEAAYKQDRVAEAFRGELAKAAKIAFDKGELEDALDLFELAIEEDSMNAALHDRYAWVLFHKTDKHERALELSRKSITLNPDNCDAVVNFAIINYALGRIDIGDEYIELSERLGRPRSFILLRKAIARFHQARNSQVSEALTLYAKAMELLQQATRVHQNITGYDIKNLRDIQKYQDEVRKKVAILEKVSKQVQSN